MLYKLQTLKMQGDLSLSLFWVSGGGALLGDPQEYAGWYYAVDSESCRYKRLFIKY